MPIRLSDLANERRDTTITTPLGPLAVTYRPNALTPADSARLSSVQGEEWVKQLLAMLEEYIVAWDLVGPVKNKVTGEAVVPADEPIPLKKEILQHVSSDLLGEIFRAVQSDRDPKPKTSAKNSGDIFGGSFA